MEVKGWHFVGCPAAIEREAIGPARDDAPHGLAERLRLTSINAQSEAVKWGGKLPVLRIGAIVWCASSKLASLGLRATCGLLFFSSCI